MPCIARSAPKGMVFLVLNRGAGRMPFLLRRGVQRFTPDGQGGWKAETSHDTSGYRLAGSWYGGFTLTAKDGAVDQFNGSGRLGASIDANGNQTIYQYDTASRLTGILAPEGTTTFTYDTQTGLLTQTTSPEGEVTTYQHNAAGQLIGITQADPDGAGPLAAPVTVPAYNAAGLLASITFPDGTVESYEYDHARRVKKVTRQDGAEESYVSLDAAALVDTSNGQGSQQSPAGLRAVEELETSQTVGGVTTTARVDRWGGAIEAVDGEAVATLYERNARGQVVKMTEPDPDGAGPLVSAVTTYEYDAKGNRTKETLPDGAVRAWEYDPVHSAVTRYVDERGLITLYTINAVSGRTRRERVVVGQPDGRGNSETNDVVTAYTYTDAADGTLVGLLEAETDPNGVVTKYEYNAKGQETRITQAFGTTEAASVQYEYNTRGLRTAEIDELGRRTDFSYDALGRLVQKTLPDPDGAGPLTRPVYAYGYHAAGYRTSETDPLGNVTSYEYDARGRMKKVFSPDPDGAGPLTRPMTESVYDATGRLWKSIDPLGRVTEYRYDNAGRQVKVIQPDPDGTGPLTRPETESVYDAAGRLVQSIDALDNVTTYEYDLRGRQTKVTQPDPDGPGPLASPVHESVYDASGQLDHTIDPLGRVTAYDYDPLGRQTKTIQPDPDGAGPLTSPVHENVYDKAGRLLQSIDPLGNVTQYQYDLRGRQVKVIQPDPDGTGPLASPETEYHYDAAAQLLQVVDPLDRVTTYEYDGLGRQTKVTQPDPDGAGPQLAPWTTFSYDAAGRLLSQADRLGNATSYAYDHLGRLTSQTDANQAVTSFSYDAAGNRLTLTDPEDNTTTWVYDGLNRVTQETNELGYSRSFAYSATGALTRRTDRLGRVRQFQYDHLGRNTAEIWYNTAPDADADQNRQNTLTFSYDAAGQLTAAGDSFAEYGYVYDSLGRATSITQELGCLDPLVVFAQAFDALGRRTRLAATVGTTADFVNDYVYDPLGRTTRIDQHGVAGGKAVATKRVDFAYDAAGQTESLTRYANLAGTQLVAATDYDFDLAGRLVGMSHFKGGTVFADYDWTFDSANRMTQFVSSQDGTADYANDSTGQLTGAAYNYQGDESYVYDENGNRTNNGYAVGTNNQMLSDGTYRYQYDAEGNRTRRFVDVNANGLLDAGDTDVTEYAWDHRDRLVQVTHRAQYAAAADQIIENSYDYANRWTRKILDDDGDGTRDYTRVFAYDGNQIALDFHRNGPCGLQNGHLRERYLWGNAVDQILAEEEVDGGGAEMVTWPLTDHLNTVRDLAKYAPATDTTTVVNHLQYNAFGKLTAQTDAAIESIFRFTARPFDTDSGLQYNHHRWYDVDTGRWISEDPVKSTSNLYAYCDNNAVIYLDPRGLWKVERKGQGHARAKSEEDDTIATLAAEIRLDVTEYRKWLSLAATNGTLKTRDRGTLSLNQLGKDDVLCPGQVVLVPNTILAVWGGNADAFGKWWVAWDTNIKRLEDAGYRVTKLDYPKAADFESRIKNGTVSGTLYGIYFWGHGLHDQSGTYVGIGLKPSEKGNDNKKSIDPAYESDFANWQNEYKLGLGWLYGCGTAAARDHFSSNADFYGQEGTLAPWPQW